MERRFISLKKGKQITVEWRMERRFKVLKKGKQDTTTRKERKLLPIEEYMETSIEKERDVLGRDIGLWGDRDVQGGLGEGR